MIDVRYIQQSLRAWACNHKYVLVNSGLELNPAYIEMAQKRLKNELCMFL